ncbi:hypothetical protein MSAN_02133100 [Mycena sanguinolenta]|uniref:Uncharacterized protein n=1 Tax=Mycena sanguinolenta TaxID=230812 RepID=A0A8H7CK32_9AGAR|nr:hypothetical protein MSAN_02133100 [Mycena sanguinolenta]
MLNLPRESSFQLADGLAGLIGAASRHASGMFSHSQKFTVTGGTFSNITNNNYTTTPSLPSDFRMIPLADIDLRHEIRLDNSMGAAYSRPRERARVRRLYSAKIEGRKSTLTVAMYQGDNAEQILSLSDTFCIIIKSPILQRFIYMHAVIKISQYEIVFYVLRFLILPQEINNYLKSEFQRGLRLVDCTKWIRGSTGRLCIELTPANDNLRLRRYPPDSLALSGNYEWSAGAETITTFIDSLTLCQYYWMCWHHLAQGRHISLSAPTTVNPDAVFHCSDLLEDLVEIAFLPSTGAPRLRNWRTPEGSTGEVMPNGWTRFQSGDVFNNTLSIFVYSSRSVWDSDTWVSQANYIFRRLHIMSNFEDYVIVDCICFDLDISETTGDLPEGFLFVCPQEDFRIGPSSCWPACTAYWSLYPSGIDCLSPEEAKQLGFPPFQLTATVWGHSWDASVYEGLRQFHEAKGFDSYSQDVALHLGYPLYQLSSQANAPFTYGDSGDEDFDADIDSDRNSAYAKEYESEYGSTCACDDSDLDIDAESSHNHETVRDPAGGSCGPEATEISNDTNHNASQSTVEEDMVSEEIFVPSSTFRIVLYIQLTAISFLAFSWVYDQVW